MDNIETKYPTDRDTDNAQGDAIESFGVSQEWPSEPERQDETVNTEPVIDAVGAPFSEVPPQYQAPGMPCNSSVLGQRPLRELDEISLAERPSASPIFSSPVLSHENSSSVGGGLCGGGETIGQARTARSHCCICTD